MSTFGTALTNSEGESRIGDLFSMGISGTASYVLQGASATPAATAISVTADIIGGYVSQSSDGTYDIKDRIQHGGDIIGGYYGGALGVGLALAVKPGLSPVALVAAGGVSGFAVGAALGTVGVGIYKLSQPVQASASTAVRSRNNDGTVTTQIHGVIGERTIDGEKVAILHTYETTTRNGVVVGRDQYSTEISRDMVALTFENFQARDKVFEEENSSPDPSTETTPSSTGTGSGTGNSSESAAENPHSLGGSRDPESGTTQEINTNTTTVSHVSSPLVRYH